MIQDARKPCMMSFIRYKKPRLGIFLLCLIEGSYFSANGSTRLNIEFDGTTTKYKARLVAKGYSQVHRMEYNDTFFPITRMDSTRLVLDIATTKRWEVHHMDVKSSFLHGDIEEEIYMR